MKTALPGKKDFRSAWLWICAIGCAAAFGGCARNSFPREALAFVHPGETTRADIIENFNAPAYDFKEPHVIAYVKDTIAGQAPHDTLHQDRNTLLYQDDPGQAGRATEALCFLLNDQDRVTRFAKIIVDGKTPLREAIKQWALHGGNEK